MYPRFLCVRASCVSGVKRCLLWIPRLQYRPTLLWGLTLTYSNGLDLIKLVWPADLDLDPDTLDIQIRDLDILDIQHICTQWPDLALNDLEIIFDLDRVLVISGKSSTKLGYPWPNFWPWLSTQWPWEICGQIIYLFIWDAVLENKMWHLVG